METSVKLEPTALIIFGAGGDLTQRKLLPALYNLYLDGWLPQQLHIMGIDLKAMSDDDFRQHIRQGIDQFSRRGPTENKKWQTFAPNLTYVSADFTDSTTYDDLTERLAAQDKAWQTKAKHIFYLAPHPP